MDNCSSPDTQSSSSANFNYRSHQSHHYQRHNKNFRPYTTRTSSTKHNYNNNDQNFRFSQRNLNSDLPTTFSNFNNNNNSSFSSFQGAYDLNNSSAPSQRSCKKYKYMNNPTNNCKSSRSYHQNSSASYCGSTGFKSKNYCQTGFGSANSRRNRDYDSRYLLNNNNDSSLRESYHVEPNSLSNGSYNRKPYSKSSFITTNSITHTKKHLRKSPTKTNLTQNQQSTLNQNTNYAQLPNICLTKIFSFLTFSESLAASATCTNWRSSLLTHSPILWNKFPLTIYLCNKQTDFKSAKFKLGYLAALASCINFKFDANDLALVKRLASSLNNAQFLNVKKLSLQPKFNLYIDEDEIDSVAQDNENQDNMCYLSKKILNSIQEIITNSKSIEHLALGFTNIPLYTNTDNKTPDMGNRHPINDLLNKLIAKHGNHVKSLHISTCANASSMFLNTMQTMHGSTIKLRPNYQLVTILPQFVYLESLSLNSNELNDSIISSSLFATSLKNLNLNVNAIQSLTESQKLTRNESWLKATIDNPSLKVTVNCLSTEEANRKYPHVLSPHMPLNSLRMFFCKSLNPGLIQFLSDNYSESLVSLIIEDAIVEPTLRYHNPLRQDADPDPLVILCWKCKELTELIIIGYEVLEINLIAIAKLRTNLKVFGVAMDCIIDLKYGKFRSDDDFVEDEDGDDTLVDCGSCSEIVMDKVRNILNNPNWHPLEKEELPLSIYDLDVPHEEAYLDKLIADQQ